MGASNNDAVSRRGFLIGAGVAGLLAGTGLRPAVASRAKPVASATVREFRLRAAPSKAQLVPPPVTKTGVWAFNGRVPGPGIRVHQGERVRIAVDNGLAEETTVHWHGLRIPNAMDGVAHLTQKPIAPGGSFIYEFDAPDAGTFWYHPHQRGFEQVGRGLYGPLIVEEPEPVAVDRDLTWVLDDWRLLRSVEISADFANIRDMAHAGRIGNTVTINGRVPDTIMVQAGERIRLRLINAANARIFALEFAGHRPRIIALDGQPVTPFEPDGGRIVLGPAMRADLIVDMTGTPGARFTVADRFYPRREYRLVDLVYGAEPLRSRLWEKPITLAPNPLPEPDLAGAKRHDITFGGGMMGRMAGARVAGEWRDIRDMMRQGLMWAINGVAATGHVLEPLAVLPRGTTHILAMNNETAWHHPIHLHGHSFRVLSRNRRATRHREWRDTVLMAPRETVEVAFVADNPGDWMFHCHILGHMAAGMMGVIRVA
jgi:FtsP/CotA-like multicopper oxidase with cupredoxin domain